MSLCRWSSMDFDCDLYVYESVGGFLSINVAGNKAVFNRDDLPNDAGDRFMEVMRRVRNCEHKPIGLPSDGRHYECYGWDVSCAVLTRLRDEGYKFPDHVLEYCQHMHATNEPMEA